MRVAVGALKGLKPGSAISKAVRDAADRLYDAFLRDPNPGRCRCSDCGVIGPKPRFHRELRTGPFDVAYSEFFKATSKDFEKMAAKLFRRWPLPDAVEPQDVVQDLHTEIARIMRGYDPMRATVAAYLVWNAFARAKKDTNRQRGKVKDHEASIHALVISGLLQPNDNGPEHFDDCIDRLSFDSLTLDEPAEAMIDSKAKLRRVFRHMTDDDKRLVRRVIRNAGNIRLTAFKMISAIEEMDADQREAAIDRKAKKLIAALQNAAAIWNNLKQEDDNGEEEQQEIGTEERRTDSDRSAECGSRAAGDVGQRRQTGSISGSICESRPEARVPNVGKARVTPRRKCEREDGAPFLLLCA
jgi:hypothetical protein